MKEVWPGYCKGFGKSFLLVLKKQRRKLYFGDYKTSENNNKVEQHLMLIIQMKGFKLYDVEAGIKGEEFSIIGLNYQLMP